eukprot:403371609
MNLAKEKFWHCAKLNSNADTCARCDEGYFLYESYQNTYCTPSCNLIANSEYTKFRTNDLQNGVCQELEFNLSTLNSSACYKHLDSESKCVQCSNGYYQSNPRILSDDCSLKSKDDPDIEIIQLTNDRTISETTTKFYNLLGAIQQAFLISNQYQTKKVVIELIDEVGTQSPPLYQVMQSDLIGVSMYQQGLIFWNSGLQLTIKTKDGKQAKIINKIGPKFQIQVARSLILENIWIDSIDSVYLSVVDDTGLHLSEETQQCSYSTININGQGFYCTVNLEEKQNVKLTNIYYELGAVISLPQLTDYNVTIENSEFDSINTCGSVVGSGFHWSSYDSDFLQQSLQENSQKFEQRNSIQNFYLELYNTIRTKTQSFRQNITIINNVFTNFQNLKKEKNYLSNKHIDDNEDLNNIPEDSDMYQFVDQNAQNIGLIVDLFEFSGNLTFQNNEISSFIQKFESCLTFDDIGDMDMITYNKKQVFQLFHLINLQRLQTAIVSIVNNKFYKISISSAIVSLISMSEIDLTQQYFTMKENSFNTILPWLSSG